MQSHTPLIRFQVRNRIRFTSSGLLKSSRTKRIAERLRSAMHSAHVPGGANRDRTGDLLLAKQALSQLSYGPRGAPLVVGLVGVEPTTPALSRRCSNQLSYRPVRHVNRTADKGGRPALQAVSRKEG